MDKVFANGTKLYKLGDNGNIEYTFSDVTSIGDFGGERTEIDVTSLDSNAREYVGGMIDNGELSLEMLASVEGYSALETDFMNNNISDYAIVFPTGTSESNMNKKFKGFIRTLQITNIEPDNILRVSATIRITGELAPYEGNTNNDE